MMQKGSAELNRKHLRDSCGADTGQGQVQDFHKDPSALQKKELQSAPVVLHPDFTLDQNSKVLTLNQGQATIFGQKYTLPALPFKLPATPALNSLQSLYPSEQLLQVFLELSCKLLAMQCPV